jgi:hypothetical protein
MSVENVDEAHSYFSESRGTGEVQRVETMMVEAECLLSVFLLAGWLAKKCCERGFFIAELTNTLNV